ncbi:hypothetical protein EWH12_10500 [Sphingobium cupriresistens]|uniref:Uncharacterized protein n=1 Tax=Sphingobium cupriresistens TaxID=1132417 RepID=A0A8G1ZFW9_9SPHN|nr:hypothetical protein EWH12_10500 [Sphingobium cupriresistens]
MKRLAGYRLRLQMAHPSTPSLLHIGFRAIYVRRANRPANEREDMAVIGLTSMNISDDRSAESGLDRLIQRNHARQRAADIAATVLLPASQLSDPARGISASESAPPPSFVRSIRFNASTRQQFDIFAIVEI